MKGGGNEKKVFLTLIFVTVVSVLTVANTKAIGEVLSPDVVQAASDGLVFLLKNLSPQSLQRLGFSTQNEIESATLGTGFQVLTIPPTAVVSRDAVIDRQSLTQTDTWEFLIVANGKALSLLKVALMNGRWTAVGLGSSGLAIELQRILEVWPISKGYEFRLVHVCQNNYYYWVKALNAYGTSKFSAYDKGYRSDGSPLVPTNVSASEGTYPDRVEVTWTASLRAESYEVYRAKSNVPGAKKTSLGTTTETIFNDTTAVPGRKYFYWVKASNTIGTSKFSAYDKGYR